MTARRRLAAAALATAVGLLPAACGGLPLGSGVHVERTLETGEQDAGAPNIRVLPPGPAPGAVPGDIVRGFLNAQADGADDYAIARAYLAPGAAWDTHGTVAVYASARYAGAAVAGAGATMGVALRRIATLDPAGLYVPRADAVADVFRLRRIAGAWRITAAPPGLQLLTGDLQRSYEPATVWWYAPDDRMLVPEVRWLPSVAGGIETQVVRALLAGPSPALAASVRTAVPSGAVLDGSVATVGGDILVDLSQQAASLTAEQAQLLLVQLAATLAHVAGEPPGAAVRLQVEGQPLPLSNAPQRLLLTAAAAEDPDTRVAEAPSVALAGNRVFALPGADGDEEIVSAAAASALARRAVVSVVPAPFGAALAALVRVRSGEQLVVVEADGAVSAIGAPGAYSAPSWSSDGTLAAGGSAGLLLRRPGAAHVVVAYPRGFRGPVTGARLARDGVRVLLVAGAAGHGVAYLSTLVSRGGRTVLTSAVPVSTGLGDVRGAGWQSAASLIMLTSRSGRSLSATQVAVDGSGPVPVPLPGAVGTVGVELAAAAGGPVLVAGAGIVERLTGDSTWVPVGSGSAPGVPG